MTDRILRLMRIPIAYPSGEGWCPARSHKPSLLWVRFPTPLPAFLEVALDILKKFKSKLEGKYRYGPRTMREAKRAFRQETRKEIEEELVEYYEEK